MRYHIFYLISCSCSSWFSSSYSFRYLAMRGEELRREWRASAAAGAGRQDHASQSASAFAAASAENPPPPPPPAPPFSVAFYVQAASGDPGVAVGALQSIRRFYPRAPVMLASAPGEDYTVLCKYYVCVAEVWREGRDTDASYDVGGGGGGGTVGVGSGGGSGGGTGSMIRITGDAGSWGAAVGAAAETAASVQGPPEICGSGRAKQFLASIRAVARWAASVDDGLGRDDNGGSSSDGGGGTGSDGEERGR